MFVRVQVVSLDTGLDTCAALLLDFGNTETVQVSRAQTAVTHSHRRLRPGGS